VRLERGWGDDGTDKCAYTRSIQATVFHLAINRLFILCSITVLWTRSWSSWNTIFWHVWTVGFDYSTDSPLPQRHPNLKDIRSRQMHAFIDETKDDAHVSPYGLCDLLQYLEDSVRGLVEAASQK